MRGTLFVLFAALLWAVDTLIRYPLLGDGLSPVTVVFIEHCILCLIFIKPIGRLIYSYLNKDSKETRSFPFIPFFIIGGIGSGISTWAFTKAFNYVNPSIVIVLQKFQPIVAILLSHFYLKERISRPFIFWGPLCFVGGLLVSYDDLSKLFQPLNSSNMDLTFIPLGYMLAIVAVIGWGATTVFGKKLFVDEWHEKEIMSGRFLFGLLTLFPLLFLEKSYQMPTLQHWFKILLMVLLSGVLAMTFYYKGLKLVQAKLCALLEMFFPFFAICVNWLILDLSLSWVSLLGAGILLLSSTIIQYKKY